MDLIQFCNSPGSAAPQSDFHSITPTLSPAAFYNNLTAGDSIRLFSLSISPVTNCGSGIYIYRNGIDPGSSAPGMGGGDFNNGFTMGSANQLYTGNITQLNPPPSRSKCGQYMFRWC
jgi:hypothetical protein